MRHRLAFSAVVFAGLLLGITLGSGGPSAQAQSVMDCQGWEQSNQDMRFLCAKTGGTLIENVRRGCLILECDTQTPGGSSQQTTSGRTGTTSMHAGTTSRTVTTSRTSAVTSRADGATNGEGAQCASWEAKNREMQAMCQGGRGTLLKATINGCTVFDCALSPKTTSSAQGTSTRSTTSAAAGTDSCSQWKANNSNMESLCRGGRGTLLKATMNGCTVYECTLSPKTTSSAQGTSTRSSTMQDCPDRKAANAQMRAYCAEKKGVIVETVRNACVIVECQTSGGGQSGSSQGSACSAWSQLNESTAALCTARKGVLSEEKRDGCPVLRCALPEGASTSSGGACAKWDAWNTQIKASCPVDKLLPFVRGDCTLYECSATTTTSARQRVSTSSSSATCSQWTATNAAIRMSCPQDALVLTKQGDCEVVQCRRTATSSSSMPLNASITCSVKLEESGCKVYSCSDGRTKTACP